MVLFKASDLEKCFDKWSHGTFYNRLTAYGIKGNTSFIVKGDSGNVLYNSKAFELLKEHYLKEFTNNTEEDKREFEKNIQSILSNTEAQRNTKENTSAKADTTDTFDKTDKSEDVNQVKYNNFIPFEVHTQIVNSLNSQIDMLKKQLERETETNEKLVNTIQLREQKEIVIEQQNLIKLQQQAEDQRALGTEEQNKSGWFSWLFKNK